MDKSSNEVYRNEKYFWETRDGKLIPITELTDLHIFNIVNYFGKQWLESHGHVLIVEHFNKLDAKHHWSQDLK